MSQTEGNIPGAGPPNADSAAQGKASQIENEALPTDQVFLALAHNHKPFTENDIVNIGVHEAIELPDEVTQRAGFPLPAAKAALMIRQFPGMYKLSLTKGASAHNNPPVEKLFTPEGLEQQEHELTPTEEVIEEGHQELAHPPNGPSPVESVITQAPAPSEALREVEGGDADGGQTI